MNDGLKKLRSYLERETLQRLMAKLRKFQVFTNHVSVNKKYGYISKKFCMVKQVLKCQVYMVWVRQFL